MTVLVSGVMDSGTDSSSNTDTIVRTITIDVLSVNDSPVLVTNGATLLEGGTVVIDNTLLDGVDPDDTDPNELTLTVTTIPSHGQLLLNGEVVTAGTNLTLEAIEAGSLSYIHDESETSADGFNVSLADGGEDGAQPAQGRFELEVTEVIDPPVELEPDMLQLAFGESFDSAQGNLLASGFSSLNNGNLSNNANLLVELEVPPSQGTVELMADGTFTYVHNGSAILNDEFSYRVTNEDGLFTIATVAVTIDPPIEPEIEPEIEPAIEQPNEQPNEQAIEQEIAAAVEETAMPVTNTLPFLELIAEQVDITVTEEPAETEQEVVQANAEPAQSAQLTENITPQLPENTVNETRRTTTSNQVEISELPEVDTLLTDFSIRETFAVTQHREAIQITNQSELLISSAATYDLTLDVHVPSAKAAASNPGFLKGLTQLEDDFLALEEENGASYKLAEDTILGVSFSVSVGGLAWALRGGAMFGSMMAFTPVWKFVEIGQVSVMVSGKKENSDDQDPNEQDDSVESLFDESEK